MNRIAAAVARADAAASEWKFLDCSINWGFFHSIKWKKLQASRRRQARKYRSALKAIRSLGGDWKQVARGQVVQTG